MFSFFPWMACTAQTRQGSNDRTTCPISTGFSESFAGVSISASSQGPLILSASRGDPYISLAHDDNDIRHTIEATHRTFNCLQNKTAEKWIPALPDYRGYRPLENEGQVNTQHPILPQPRLVKGRTSLIWQEDMRPVLVIGFRYSQMPL